LLLGAAAEEATGSPIFLMLGVVQEAAVGLCSTWFSMRTLCLIELRWLLVQEVQRTRRAVLLRSGRW
jgi:hypothetical protein